MIDINCHSRGTRGLTWAINGEAMFRSFVILLLTVLLGCTQSKTGPNVPPQSTQNEPSTVSSVAPSETSLIQGTWEIVKAERDGTAKPDEVGGTVTFESGNAAIRTPSGDVSKYKVVLHPDQQPKAIDWIIEQDNQTHVLHGLYELNGDRLINCSPAGFGLPRPTALGTTKGDGCFYFELKRRKNNTKS